MEGPSPRLLVGVGAALTLTSGWFLYQAGSKTVGSDGPYAFIHGFFPICFAPGALLGIAAGILFVLKERHNLAGTLGIGGALLGIPFALAGLWIGFGIATAGSILVLVKSAPGAQSESGEIGVSVSHISRTKRSLLRYWSAPSGIAVVATVGILLVCPQTISADITVLQDFLNNPVEYDLQVGYVFREGGSSLMYEVDATPQSSDCHGGFSYLLNAYLNDSGQVYWYQVGLSFNWAGGTFHSSGWALTYEVFGPSGYSIYPALFGGAGVAPFSGPINTGDPVLLSMTLGKTVVDLTGIDLSTGATANAFPQREGTSHFGDGVPSQNGGYFTGLMTECYRDNPNDVRLSDVTYQDWGTPQPGASVFVDELDFSWGKKPYLPTSELPANRTAMENFSGPSLISQHVYGVAILYNATTFITGSSRQS